MMDDYTTQYPSYAPQPVMPSLGQYGTSQAEQARMIGDLAQYQSSRPPTQAMLDAETQKIRDRNLAGTPYATAPNSTLPVNYTTADNLGGLATAMHQSTPYDIAEEKRMAAMRTQAAPESIIRLPDGTSTNIATPSTPGLAYAKFQSPLGGQTPQLVAAAKQIERAKRQKTASPSGSISDAIVAASNANAHFNPWATGGLLGNSAAPAAGAAKPQPAPQSSGPTAFLPSEIEQAQSGVNVLNKMPTVDQRKLSSAMGQSDFDPINAPWELSSYLQARGVPTPMINRIVQQTQEDQKALINSYTPDQRNWGGTDIYTKIRKQDIEKYILWANQSQNPTPQQKPIMFPANEYKQMPGSYPSQAVPGAVIMPDGSMYDRYGNKVSQ